MQWDGFPTYYAGCFSNTIANPYSNVDASPHTYGYTSSYFYTRSHVYPDFGPVDCP